MWGRALRQQAHRAQQVVYEIERAGQREGLQVAVGRREHEAEIARFVAPATARAQVKEYAGEHSHRASRLAENPSGGARG